MADKLTDLIENVRVCDAKLFMQIFLAKIKNNYCKKRFMQKIIPAISFKK